MFYFIRHGQTDYTEQNTKIYQGFGVNLAPLSAKGIRQIRQAAKDPRLQGADIILSSPYTRALQTAAILSKELQVDIAVETGLHEWLANKNYIYESDAQADKNYMEFEVSSGKYPDQAEKDWEDAERMRQRMLAVLEKYRHYSKVIVACHGMLIQATAGDRNLQNGEILEYRLD